MAGHGHGWPSGQKVYPGIRAKFCTRVGLDYPGRDTIHRAEGNSNLFNLKSFPPSSWTLFKRVTRELPKVVKKLPEGGPKTETW